MTGLYAQLRARNAHAGSHPGHQRVFRQRAVAITHAVTVLGWKVTERRHLDAGVMTGPCALCRRPCVRYGTKGTPWCDRCQMTNERIKGS